MRPPRYRFPDDVRSATREMARRMVAEGDVPDTPERLEEWLHARPELLGRLERGGYGDRFGADDLFPLLRVMVEGAGGSIAPAADAVPPPRSHQQWIWGAAVFVLVVLVGLAVLLGR